MVSIIVPTYNEGSRIAETITLLKSAEEAGNIREIIIADGGSTDDTVAISKKLSASVIVVKGKNRSAQLNAAAGIAKGTILFFLHADSVPPQGYLSDILGAVKEGYKAGCFRLRFDQDHWFLKANAWFTRFDNNLVRFGDQGLFVTSEVFSAMKGYDDRLTIMEDQEIIFRIKKLTPFKVISRPLTTSSRKYQVNGVYKTQGTFYLIWLLYYLGVSQRNLIGLHSKLSRKDPHKTRDDHGNHS